MPSACSTSALRNELSTYCEARWPSFCKLSSAERLSKLFSHAMASITTAATAAPMPSAG